MIFFFFWIVCRLHWMKFLLFRIWYSTHLYAAHETFLVNQIWQIHFKLATSTFEHIISELHFAWIHTASKIRERETLESENWNVEVFRNTYAFIFSWKFDWAETTLPSAATMDKHKIHKINSRCQCELAWSVNRPLVCISLSWPWIDRFLIKVYFKFYSLYFIADG